MPRYAPAVDAQFAEAQVIHEDEDNVGFCDLPASGWAQPMYAMAPGTENETRLKRMSLMAMPSGNALQQSQDCFVGPLSAVHPGKPRP